MSTLKKILVIGASIAGPAVCYWLKRFGFSPTLIERHDKIREGGYAIDIRGIATQIAHNMGVYKQVCDMRTQLHMGRYVDADGNVLFEEEGEKFGFRQGEDVEIVRGDLVKILMQTISDVPCQFSQSIHSIQQHADFVHVSFKDGTTEQFDLVIGADGLHSSTRQMIFSKDEYNLVDLGAYISVFSTPNHLKLNHSEILFEAGQKLVHLSSDKDPNMAHAGFLFRSNHVLNNIRDEKEQKQFLNETFLNLGWETNQLLKHMESSDDMYFDSITQVKMNHWTKGRVALLGDAAFCASPLSGQGSSLALVGAYLLAGELKKAENNYSVAFERYNTLLHPFVEANQRFGVWSSENFLVSGEAHKDVAEERTNKVLEKLEKVSNAITLPEY